MEQTKVYVILVHQWGTQESDYAEVYENKFFLSKEDAVKVANEFATKLIEDEDSYVHDVHRWAQKNGFNYTEDCNTDTGCYEWLDFIDGFGMSIQVTELSINK